MTTVSEIITQAYRESNLIPVGATPDDSEMTEGLQILNRYVKSLFGSEMGEPLETIALGKKNITTPDNVVLYMDDLLTYYVPENTRVQANLLSATTINLCPNPKDGSRVAVIDNSENFATYPLTIIGNGRQIEGETSVVLNTNGVIRQWFYREDLGQWNRLTDLTLTDVSPFPDEFDDLLILGVQRRINPRAGAQAAPESVQYYTDILRKFKARYRQMREMPAEQGIVRLPGNRAIRGTLNSNRNFDRGVPQW